MHLLGTSAHRIRKRAIIAALLALAACTPRRSPRCERVCVREAECAEELRLLENDRGECLDACTALERDPNLLQSVERHAACIEGATSCLAVIACD